MKVVIIGSGAAGFTAAEAMRKNDNDCEVRLFTEEAYPPYFRPRLIDVLSGKVIIEETYIKKVNWYKENNIDLQLNKRAISVDTAGREVVFEDGSKAAYDKLLLAMGCYPFKPQVEGINSQCIYVLRTAKDVHDIIECAGMKKRAVIVGGGLLGLETANSLCSMGVKSVVVECFNCLMPKQVDREGAGFLREILEQRGIDFSMGTEVESIALKGEALAVKLKNGDVLETDFIIISSGVRCSVDIARKAGIEVNMGVIVDDNMKTSAENVYAAGDVCEHRKRVYGIWPVAREQAIIAADNITGKETVYNGSLFSTRLKVTGIDLNSIGDVSGNDCEQFKVFDKDKNIYRKLFTREGVIVGAILFGDTAGSMQIQKLIKEKTKVSGDEQNIIEGKKKISDKEV